MALTRRALKAMGIDEEKIDEIIALHTETVEGLKNEAARYKEQAGQLEEMSKELDTAKSELDTEKKAGWKAKYDSLKEEYESYKKDQDNKAAHAAKETAYKDLLKAAGISEKRLAAVLRVSDIDGIELDADGKVKDAEKLTQGIKSEWADFIVSQETKGADIASPPANNPASGKKVSRAAQIAAEYHNNLYGAIGTKGKETA